MMSDEQRPVDLSNEAGGITSEAAFLAEHIRDTDPQWKREELMDTLISMIDDANEAAFEAAIRLEDGDGGDT